MRPPHILGNDSWDGLCLFVLLELGGKLGLCIIVLHSCEIESDNASRAKWEAHSGREVYYVARKFGVSAETAPKVIENVRNGGALEKMWIQLVAVSLASAAISVWGLCPIIKTRWACRRRREV